MSQSLAKVLVHLIFSTKGRRRLIHDDVRDELNTYVVGILRNRRMSFQEEFQRFLQRHGIDSDERYLWD